MLQNNAVTLPPWILSPPTAALPAIPSTPPRCSQTFLVQLHRLKTPRIHLCTSCTNPINYKLCLMFLRWKALGCDCARLSPDSQRHPSGPARHSRCWVIRMGWRNFPSPREQIWTVLITFHSSFHAVRLTLGQLMSNSIRNASSHCTILVMLFKKKKKIANKKK